MRRERYVFNKQTLRYEKVVEPLSTTLLRVFGFVCAALFTAFIFTLIAHQYFPSPKEKELQAKVERLEAFLQNECYSRRLEKCSVLWITFKSAMPTSTG